MDWIEIKERFESWDRILIQKQKRYIHFYSMRNFVFHFNSLPNEAVKEKVATIIEEYVQEVEYNNCDYGGIDSFELTRKYMNKISSYYTMYLGFKSILVFRFVAIFGILGDTILYLFLNNSLKFFFPAISLCLLAHYTYVKFFFEKKKKVFGIYY
jgi:hypothetical protein